MISQGRAIHSRFPPSALLNPPRPLRQGSRDHIPKSPRPSRAWQCSRRCPPGIPPFGRGCHAPVTSRATALVNRQYPVDPSNRLRTRP